MIEQDSFIVILITLGLLAHAGFPYNKAAMLQRMVKETLCSMLETHAQIFCKIAQYNLLWLVHVKL